MKVSMEKIENNVVKLEVTVEAKKFNEAMKKSYAKNVKKFNVPGFRKGKAPMSIIKRYYGETVFYEDAINICCDDTYPKALEEKEIKPVDYPQIDIVEIGEGKDFVYTAQVTVMPEVELGEYKGLEAKKVSYDVKDEDVENTLKEMQQRNARIQTKEDEEAIEKGNIAVIDFKGYVDEVPFEGGEGYDYSLEIGSGTFIDNFEDQLIGAKKGEEKEVKVKFPEEYGSEELNGKEAKFQVTIKEIKVKELPAIDDEFVKEVSEFDTLDELKEDIKAKIKEGNDKRAKAEYEEAVINLACENAKVDIPEVMVENEINNMLKDLEMKLRYQGIDLETYYQYTNSTEEKVREYMKEAATKRVKTDLVLAEVAKAEKLEATDEEIMDRAKEMAKQYGSGELEKTAKLLADSQNALLKADVINEKVVKLIVDNSKEIE
ncbi:trigger factor [Clostridium tetani]|uniref:Trigger factor n=1 Tax=Clostridium tetani TaxID=1513 RepID=A0A4V1LEP9_CLOTA|nr:trigger factor [Clostridium tetani]KGI45078.1 trigger factor [Clostridium tetani]RXI48905.1 trigger factor [Clostridium tetani]RXI73537.1 trigger factor [Clostridium tetani]BDR68117.1 trigger factor [Clostridium tetani]BDR76539.1 trigger factor [Clostridium tetani]